MPIIIDEITTGSDPLPTQPESEAAAAHSAPAAVTTTPETLRRQWSELAAFQAARAARVRAD